MSKVVCQQKAADKCPDPAEMTTRPRGRGGPIPGKAWKLPSPWRDGRPGGWQPRSRPPGPALTGHHMHTLPL